jgi:metal-sulfur cluster biosynthetic enzyme
MGMKPEMIKKIDSILERVKDPESDLPVAQLGLIQRVRYNEEKKTMYIFTNLNAHVPKCNTCRFIAAGLMARITKDLEAAFKAEFPDLSVEFV